MHKYELIFILQADLDEATLDAAVENIETLIKNNQGEIAKTDRWGKRKLAYPIRKMNEGYYVLVNFDYNPEEVAALKRTIGFNEQILRSSIVRID
ncbi:MAG: 30S ribosomal protein S6 [Anaerolineaceae bacterium]|jgi:small subunit ribosomal protein S6